MALTMNGKWMFRLVPLGLLAALSLSATAWAAPPWVNLIGGARVSADPDADYRLTEENGPWMIMACSFSGEGAAQQAKELVLELRKRYKLEAYVHDTKFDYRDDLRQIASQGFGPNGRQLVPKHHRKSVIDEYAVLVGNFRAVDDADAQHTLDKIKYAKPECLNPGDGQTNQSLAGWRLAQKKVQEIIGSGEKTKGYMGHAFITTNPLLPKEYFTPDGLDPFVVKLNKGVPYSLLECPGRYTVQVAKFTGEDTIDQKKVNQLKDEDVKTSKLEKGAICANTMVKALRMEGYEAYVLHDRYLSIVTVGSFDSVGTPRPDGQTEINPIIHKIMETFGAEAVTVNGRSTGAMKQKKIGPFPNIGEIAFDIQPMPVEVPKQTISANLSGNMLGLH